MNRHHFLRRLGMLALLLGSAAAIPQQAANRYTVEIVVFRNGGQAAALDASSTASISGDDVEATVVATRKLSGAASRLRSGGMRVLAHTAWTQTAAGFSSRRGVSAANLGMAGVGISGKVMLLRGSFLNLGVDLTIDDGGRRYRITEIRNNIKADQIQYFDHPAIGVLAVVSAGG